MKTISLGSVIEECSERNRTSRATEVFSVTNSEGFIKSTEYFDKEVFSKNTSNYKVVYKGQFAYNPSRINVGSIDYLKRNNPVIVSPLYVIFKCKDVLHPEYLKRFLKSPLGLMRIRLKTKGAVRDTLSFKSLSDIEINLPSLDEQRYIATILEKTEFLIQKRRESIYLLDEFLKSTFLDMFGDPGTKSSKWKIEKLESCFSSKPLIGSMVPAINIGDVPIVRVGELGNREINLSKCKFSNLEQGDFEKYKLKNGDVLIARAIGSESHLGKASIFIDRGQPVVYDSHVMRIRFNPTKIHPDFFYTFLQTSGGRSRFLKKAGQTAVQFNINSKQISDIDMPVPPISLQKEFARVVERTLAIKAQYEVSFQELTNLYASLSQRVFKGELQFKSDAKVVPLQANEKEEDYFKKRKALACYVINQSLDDDKFGDTKFEKLLNLSDQFAIQRYLGQTYYQKVAGPYDNEFTKLFYIQIAAEKLYKRKRNGKQSVFIPDINHKKTFTAENYFSTDELARVDKLITYFKKYTYEEPEIISTLYAVWNNRIIRQQQITDEVLKQDFLDWDEKKKKYKDRLDAALVWMRKENIIPNGWGKLIEKPKGKQRKLVVGKKRTNSKRAS